MTTPVLQPVWPDYFADPFVLRSAEEYFAYGTGAALERDAQGKAGAFQILRSRDLVSWARCGVALEVPPERATHAYWAPEVAAARGRFFLYYSRAPAGEDEKHRVFVAGAERPAGPFREIGRVLPEKVGFCIDAHPFRDPRDGRWYLFFARDSFEERAGTGIAVVPLHADMERADGDPVNVVRANHDWQIYERDRSLYGRVWAAWHTVEGPCVVERAGRYYCFYSGGNWQTENYGVSFAEADHPLGPWRHAVASGPVVLAQVPGVLIGPGHNSVTTSPNGREQVMVFHAWDRERTARRMFVAPIEWTDGGPRVRL
jgi:GH43 family beta-xylosidase